MTKNLYPLRVITVSAPHAWLIAGRLKHYETRTWAHAHRGLIAIHVGKNLSAVGGVRGLFDLCSREPFASALAHLGIVDPLAEPRGRIIAIGKLTAIHTAKTLAPTLDSDELAFGDYTEGRFAWQLDSVAKLRKPIVVPGQQGLWNYTPPSAAVGSAIR